MHQSIFQDLAASQRVLRLQQRMASPQCDSLTIDVPPHPSQKPSHFFSALSLFSRPCPFFVSCFDRTTAMACTNLHFQAPASHSRSNCKSLMIQPQRLPHSLPHPAPLAHPIPLGTLAPTILPDPSAPLSLPRGPRNACTSPQLIGPCLTRGPTSPATQTDGSTSNATLPFSTCYPSILTIALEAPIHPDLLHCSLETPSPRCCCQKQRYY